MPASWNNRELTRRQNLAIQAMQNGQTFRALWYRLMVTKISDALKFKLWK